MNVFKFGGASVKDAAGVQNLEQIVRMNNTPDGLMVVVSAMGKTTNALERVVEFLETGKEEMALNQWVDIIDHHVAIMKELGLQPGVDIRLQLLQLRHTATQVLEVERLQGIRQRITVHAYRSARINQQYATFHHLSLPSSSGKKSGSSGITIVGGS